MITNFVKKTNQYILDKNYRFLINSTFHLYDKMPDDVYLHKLYKASMGKELDLVNPKTFNEKLQWLKLYNRRKEYTKMVDKYEVRNYIADTIGQEYLIPLIGVWENPKAIDFSILPEQFVIKCTHNSGLGMTICKNKSILDISTTKRNLHRGWKQDYFKLNREWPYKDVTHRIIAEKYMDDGRGQLRDYKFHCFNGKCEFILVCDNRFASTGVTEDFYSPDWEHLDIKRPGIKNTDTIQNCPEKLTEMINLAEKLSEGIPFVRIDFYLVNHMVYFGEITFFPASGLKGFVPEEWDLRFGELIQL